MGCRVISGMFRVVYLLQTNWPVMQFALFYPFVLLTGAAMFSGSEGFVG